MDEKLTNEHRRNVRLALSRRLQEFYATLKGYFSEDASAVLQQAENRPSPRDPDNGWRRIG
jgi:hypothetical protein